MLERRRPGAALETELRAEFPDWRIRAGESGNWTAVRKGLGVVVAPSAVELADHLRWLEADLETRRRTRPRPAL